MNVGLAGFTSPTTRATDRPRRRILQGIAAAVGRWHQGQIRADTAKARFTALQSARSSGSPQQHWTAARDSSLGRILRASLIRRPGLLVKAALGVKSARSQRATVRADRTTPSSTSRIQDTKRLQRSVEKLDETVQAYLPAAATSTHDSTPYSSACEAEPAATSCCRIISKERWAARAPGRRSMLTAVKWVHYGCARRGSQANPGQLAEMLNRQSRGQAHPARTRAWQGLGLSTTSSSTSSRRSQLRERLSACRFWLAPQDRARAEQPLEQGWPPIRPTAAITSDERAPAT